MSTLLADLVASRQLQPEPVATDGLVHLLGRSPAGRAVMNELLLDLTTGATTDGLAFTGQVVAQEDGGRPDIIGSDQSGVRLVIEAKFDAELTPAQLGSTYLDRLQPGAPGALVFLVPQDRIAALWPRVLSGPGGQPKPITVDPALADADMVRHSMTDGRVLAAISWNRLLTALRQAMDAASEIRNMEDLAQIQGLVTWRGRVGWTPVLPGDLPDRAGRQLAPLVDSVLRAAGRVSSTKTRNGSADGGPGRYMTTPGGWTIWVGVWFPWWSDYGNTPAWAQVRASSAHSVTAIAARFAGRDHVVFPRPTHSDVLIPLPLPPGAERGELEADLLQQLHAISSALDTVPATTHATEQSEDVEAQISSP